MDNLYRVADAFLSAVLWLIAAGGVVLALALGLGAPLLYACGVTAFAVLIGTAARDARRDRRK